MSLGPVMTDIAGTALTDEERRRLQRPEVGGLILFTRNYESPQQLAELLEEVHRLRSPRLLIAVDHEGGRVQRFRDGFTKLPPVGELGVAWDADPHRARQLAQVSGWLMAAELRAVGVDISFAPVLDIDRKISAVIGDRAFHREPEVIAELAQAYQRGMGEAGMAATGKHFPGHGGVIEDSHVALPVDIRKLADLQLEDMLPFERLIHQGLAGVMVAHVIYENIDPQLAGFSPFWVNQVLRGELGFQGVVFTDDLSMIAAEAVGGPASRAQAALAAGCDMVLVCNQPESADEVIDRLAGYENPASQTRLIRLHGKGRMNWQQLHDSEQWRRAVEQIASYDVDPLLDMDM